MRDKTKYLYDFKNHRLGDKVAASYILQYLIKERKQTRIHVVDFMPDSHESFPIIKYFPDICRFGYSKNHGQVPHGEYSELTFNNLWISAPSLLQDTGFLPKMSNVKRTKQYVTLHGLFDAPYNKGRNHTVEQIEELLVKLKGADIPVVVVPTDKSLSVCDIIDHVLCNSALHIGGDTSFSHICAALDKEIIAIYGDNNHDILTYRPLKEQLKASHDWCSDPISKKCTKFIMKNNLFDVDAVFQCVKQKWNEKFA